MQIDTQPIPVRTTPRKPENQYALPVPNSIQQSQMYCKSQSTQRRSCQDLQLKALLVLHMYWPKLLLKTFERNRMPDRIGTG